MTAPIAAIGGRPTSAAGAATSAVGTPAAGNGATAPTGARDQADVSPEALQEGAEAQNPEMKQQMQRMMNDARLMQGVQSVHAEQQKGDKGNPQQAMERLGQDYKQIKEKGGEISPNVEQEVQKTLGPQQSQEQPQEAGQAAGGEQPGGEADGGQSQADPAGGAQAGGEQPGGAQAGGQQASGAGAPQQSSGASPGGASPSGSSASPAANEAGAVSPPADLAGDERRTADFINQYLRGQNSPAANQGTGEMMVRYGRENNVDPLALLAVAGQETQFGKRGVGVNGMLGVGAYDNNPRNAVNNSRFSGVENQVRRGAETFNRLRSRGGSSASDNIGNQLSAVNRAGWATDRNWHNGVQRQYNQIARAAQQYNTTHPASPPNQSASSQPQTPTQSAPATAPARTTTARGDD